VIALLPPLVAYYDGQMGGSEPMMACDVIRYSGSMNRYLVGALSTGSDINRCHPCCED
jgi:hypothetical protein